MQLLLWCFILVVSSQAATISLGKTSYDAQFSKECGSNQAIYRIVSNHNNNKEDREWTYYCSNGYDVDDSTSVFTGTHFINVKQQSKSILQLVYSFVLSIAFS